MRNVLAIDMGATSIRAILGSFNGKKISIREVMRFSHERIQIDNRSRWNFDYIMNNISKIIRENKDHISSIGIDTWGVDFGLIGDDGKLLSYPISYRDPKHEIGFKAARELMDFKEIFLCTGNQIMSINTLFQLITLKILSPDVLKRAKKLLMLPDLINYCLTGSCKGELTIASTSQLLDLNNNRFSDSILSNFNLSPELFPEITVPGRLVGSTMNSRLPELTNTDIPVISVASHDTASAVTLTKAFTDPDFLFLSSGTWSLLGCVTPVPIISDHVYESNLTNEAGYDNKNLFFKNITGLYILEKLKTQLEKQLNSNITFDEISEHIKNIDYDFDIFDVENPDFAADEYDCINLIKKNISTPIKSDFDLFSIVYNSLVASYIKTMKQIESLTKRKFKGIHIIGGGAKSDYLCQLIADKTNLSVIAGPYEATALGNIIIQLIYHKDIKSIHEGLEIIKNSIEIKEYKGGR